MLEIIIVWKLCQSIGNKMRAKGRSATWLQVLLVVSWFGTEFVCGFIGGMLSEPTPEDGFPLLPYVLALVGAACAAGVCFLIAHSLSDLSGDRSQQYAYDGDDFEDPGNPYASRKDS